MKKVFLSFTAITMTIISYSQSGEKWSFGLNSPSGSAALGTNNNFPLIIKTNGTEWVRVTPSGNVGIGVIAPADKLQVAGRVNAVHFKADSLMQALDMKAASAEFAIALITGNLNVNGQVTAGSLTVSGNTQLANVTANNAAINGQLTTGNITSPSGSIDFGNNNLSTSGNISSSNISSLTTDVSNLQSSINNIQSSQWSTNPDSSISFPGNVFVKTLNATDFVSIGSFRFSNGGAVPVPIIRDTIRSPNEVVVHSEAEKIMLSANQVEAQQQLGVGKTPGTNIALDVLGNIQASGSISSSSITTSQLAINGAIEADTIHSRKQMLVNNSLKLAKEDTDAYAEISAVNSGIALVLQKDTASNVGIGTTPAAGEKLTVAGNVGISGNLRLVSLSDTGSRMAIVDASGILRTIGGGIPINPCPGLDFYWRTDGNSIPSGPLCNPFIGTTNNFPLNFRTSNLPRMTIEAGGNVGIGTSTPYKKLTIQGDVSFVNYDASNNYQILNSFEILGNNGVPTRRGVSLDNDPNGSVNFYIHSYQNPSAFNFKNGNGNTTLVTIDAPTGCVVINDTHIPVDNTNPIPYKLAVNGRVLAQEYVIRVRQDWPDYIFKQKLQPWEKFQQEVDIMGHFPGLPSAKEVHKKKTFSLGDVQVGHLAITELMYRYLGETKNQIAELEQENKALKQENADLKTRVEKIEKLLEQK